MLEDLQEKIQGNNLTGELDHPGERLEVFLANVSHKIEEIKYDKGSRTVRAKIRLIEGTTAGNNAIALHKAGVTLGISSRAIGVIKESKALLKKIITFDIVSTPGFKSAMLKPINESLGFDNDSSDLGIFEITEQKYIDKYSYLLKDETIENKNEDNNKNETEMDKDLFNKINESLNQLQSEIQNVNERLDGFATYNEKHVESLNEFAGRILQHTEDYQLFKEQFITYNEKETQKLEDFKNQIMSHSGVNERIDEFVSRFENYNENETEKLNSFIKQFMDYNERETQKLESLRTDVETIDAAMKKFIEMYEEHSEKETAKLNAFVDHQDSITEKLNDLVEHQHNETEKLNMFVEHQDEITEKLEEFVQHQHEETEKLNKFVDHQDEETRKLNKFVEHQDSITEKLEDMVNHQHSETEKLNMIVEYLDSTADLMEKFVENDHKKTEQLNEFGNWSKEKIEELYENAKFKTFINKQNKLNIDLQNISESVETVLENARKQKAFKNSVITKYPFLELLSEERQQEFLKLDDTRKTMIIEAIKEKGVTTERDIIEEWKNVVSLTNENELVWLINAPKEYQNMWESLNQISKTKVVKLAGMRNFKSQQDINKFWSGLKLANELQKVNESENLTEFDAKNAINEVKSISKNWKLGYSQDYVERVKNIIKKDKY